MKIKLWIILIIWITVTSAILAITQTHISLSNLPLTGLSQTKGIQIDQDFSFSISPNGRQLLFFSKDLINKENSSHNPTYRLNVLDLQNGQIRQQQLEYNEAMDLWINLTNDCWTKDSQFCIAPVPGATPNAYATVSPEFVIDISDSHLLKIRHQTLLHFNQTAPMKFMDFNRPFGCSDCHYGSEPRDKSGKRIRYSSYLADPAITTPDGKTIYEVKSERGGTAAIYATQIGKPLGQKLARFKSPGFIIYRKVNIGRLRLSPSGRRLAFQVQYGSTFVSPPKLYVIDIQNYAITYIAENVYYDVHWTANPERLYFYKCDRGGSCGGPNDYLYFVEP